MANSRNKGKNGEREVAKILSDIFGGSFTRVPSSGAFVGGSNSHRLTSLSEIQGRAFRGDIIPPDFLPNLYLEIKSYIDFKFHQLIQSGPCPLLDSWIKQTLEGVKKDDVWFIMFKITKKGWYIVVPESEVLNYTLDNYSFYKSPYGSMLVTDLLTFLKENHQVIARKANSVPFSRQTIA